MERSDRDETTTSALPVFPVLFALAVAIAALAALFWYGDGAGPAVAVEPPGSRAMAQRTAPPPATPQRVDADAMPTARRSPGYASRGGGGLSPRAQNLAKAESVAALLARLQAEAGQLNANDSADLAGALAAAEKSLGNVRRELATDELSSAQNRQLLERLEQMLSQLEQIEGFERP